MRFRLIHYLVLVLSLFAISCTLQKRVYRKGYFVQRPSQKSAEAETPANYHLKTVRHKTPVSIDQTINKKPTSPVSENVFAAVSSTPNTGRKHFDSEPCDSLFLKDGSVIEVMVKEINPKDIRYKLCNFSEGPDYLVEKFRVSHIRYYTGKIEVFDETPPPPTVKKKTPESLKPKGIEKNTNAAMSLSWGILGIFPLYIVGSIVGLIFGIIALNQFNLNPGRYSNELTAKFGLGISIAGLAFWMILILLFLI